MSQPKEGDEFKIICFHCQENTLQHYLRSETFNIEVDGQEIPMTDSWYFCTACRRENKVEDI
ncbi:hypothetical protein BKI52_32950 [marine bacterium AO1-C]|nr:hypothetical protein BKI52_32950 [marine bacterium AO1-C]